MCDLLSVSKKEIIENIEDDNFFRRFGNPVKFDDEKLVLISCRDSRRCCKSI